MLTPRQKAIREKWHRGDIKYLLHSGQKVIQAKMEASTGQLFVANVSRQFGKSYWAVTCAVQLAMRKKGSRIKYATAFHTDLVEFIIPTFQSVLEDCPFHLRPVWKVHGSKWCFPNGSEIKLVGLDRTPNSLRGNVIDMIIIDEAGFVENLDYIYSSVIIPATTHRPDCKIILISTPPATPAHPFVEFIQRAEPQNAYIRMEVYDNPRINEVDIERLARAVGGKHTTTFRREFLCELILDEDLALIPEFSDDIVGELPISIYHELYHKYVGMDLGRRDHTALVFGYYDFKQAVLQIEDEITMAGPTWTTVTLKDEVIAKEQALWGDHKPFRRISDNNNPHLIMDLNALYGVHFVETSKESLEAMVNEVRIMVGSGHIRIHPRCKMLIGCLKYGLWDKNRKEFARNKIYGHFDHLAALIYLVRNLAKNSNPIPIDFGHDHTRSWMGHVKDDVRHSRNARTLASSLIPKRAR